MSIKGQLLQLEESIEGMEEMGRSNGAETPNHLEEGRHLESNKSFNASNPNKRSRLAVLSVADMVPGDEYVHFPLGRGDGHA